MRFNTVISEINHTRCDQRLNGANSARGRKKVICGKLEQQRKNLRSLCRSFNHPFSLYYYFFLLLLTVGRSSTFVKYLISDRCGGEIYRGIVYRVSKISFRKIGSRIGKTGSRILRLLVFVIVAMLQRSAEGGDVSSGVQSWRRVGYNDRGGTESLYIGYGGNPWGAASTAVYLRNHRPTLSSKLRNDSVTSRDDVTAYYRPSTGYAILPRRDSPSLRRSKRGVVHLYNMVLCATGCNPLAYKGYGCYCGFLGSGFTMDGIDRCCKMHDWCYEATDCLMFSEYFVPYYWKCYHGYKPICAVEHGDWGASGSCAQRLCECDRALAECLRRYPCPRTKAMCTSSPWRLVQNIFMLL